MNKCCSMTIDLNLNKIIENSKLIENEKYSNPSIIDDLFNDISIGENLKIIYSREKNLPRSGIYYIKQGHNKTYFNKYKPEYIDYDLFYYNYHQQEYISSNNILSSFSKQIKKKDYFM
ncbi:unnamed protein product, partial [Rotaria sp. Silwood1]